MNLQDLMSALLLSTKNISQSKFERILKRSMHLKSIHNLVAVTSSGILKAKQKLDVTFNFNKLGLQNFQN